MSEQKRISWLTRISISPVTQAAFRAITDDIKQPMSTVIGRLIEDFVTAKSTS
jgi:hypothetical protein